MRDPAASNLGDKFDNINKIMPQTVPMYSESREMHGHDNFRQPPTSFITGMNHFQTCPSAVLGSTYLPQNDTFSHQNSHEQNLSSANSSSETEENAKSAINNGLNEHLRCDYRRENVSDYIIPQTVYGIVNNVLRDSEESEILPEPRLSDMKRKSLEKTVKLLENILNEHNTKSEELISESDPLALSETKGDSIRSDSDDEVLIKKVSKKRKTSRPNKKVSDKSTKESDITKIAKEPELTEEQIISESIDNIQVKIEQTSWSDIDYNNPFHRDCNGMPRHEVGEFKVINMENSYQEALDTIKYGHAASSIAYFECPHCSLLLIHPKRFLIHVKWHNFGPSSKKEENSKQRELNTIGADSNPTNMSEVTKVMPKDGQKVYSCKDCDAVFNGRSGLKSHRHRHHPYTQTECKVCLVSVSGRAELKAHLLTHKDKEHGYHQCPNCPKRFKFQHSLIKHSDTHLDKTHSCPECSKKFGSDNLLKLHMKTHERMAKGTTFHCLYCGKGFYDNYSLTIHERTHRNDKPYQCDMCKSSFFTHSSLKRHMKVSHESNKTKPFTCDVCLKCFSTEAIRDRHELREHSDTNSFPYPCELCEKRYLSAKYLKNHLYKAHRKKQLKMEKLETSS